MPYIRQFFKKKQVLKAEHLNHMEDGIVAVESIANNALPKNQGSSNVGKILVVGADGNFVLIDMPEAMSGDIVGTLDENNNIVITGDLADGTYVLKYEKTDGTYTILGSLVVGGVVQYSITATLTECTAVSGNAVIINEGDTVTLKYVANDGFALTDTIAVSGASYTWDSDTGILVLSNPTSDVTVAITATKSGYTNIIDTVGYTDGIRLSASDGVSERDAAGYCMTGIITIPGNSTLRTDGVDFTNENYTHSMIYYYKANDEEFIGAYRDNAGTIGGSSSLPITNDGNGNLTIENRNPSAIKIRLCGYGSGANLIVTINEEITE